MKMIFNVTLKFHILKEKFNFKEEISNKLWNYIINVGNNFAYYNKIINKDKDKNKKYYILD